MSFRTDDGYLACWTDGACLGNGQHGAKAGIGVYFGDYHPWNVSEPLNPDFRQTNNTAEIRAAVEAIYQASENGVTSESSLSPSNFNYKWYFPTLEFKREPGEYYLEINSDSYFMIQGITNWIYNWECNGWRTLSGKPVVNKFDFLDLRDSMDSMEDVVFSFVPGHSGSYENDQADKLARAGAMMNWHY